MAYDDRIINLQRQLKTSRLPDNIIYHVCTIVLTISLAVCTEVKPVA